MLLTVHKASATTIPAIGGWRQKPKVSTRETETRKRRRGLVVLFKACLLNAGVLRGTRAQRRTRHSLSRQAFRGSHTAVVDDTRPARGHS